MIPANEALERLQEGNKRFAANVRGADAILSQVRRAELVNHQAPFAIVLGCADSRVPAEIVFDQGLGDLFVVRVAGNIVAPSQIGSVEFAAERFGTRLVVVMGHTHCGAVGATVDHLLTNEPATAHLGSIVDRIRPAVRPLLGTSLAGDRDGLVRAAVRANVLASAHQLRSSTALLERLTRENGLLVVGAEYDLETGVVEFFDGAS